MNPSAKSRQDPSGSKYQAESEVELGRADQRPTPDRRAVDDIQTLAVIYVRIDASTQ